MPPGGWTAGGNGSPTSPTSRRRGALCLAIWSLTVSPRSPPGSALHEVDVGRTEADLTVAGYVEEDSLLQAPAGRPADARYLDDDARLACDPRHPGLPHLSPAARDALIDVGHALSLGYRIGRRRMNLAGGAGHGRPPLLRLAGGEKQAGDRCDHDEHAPKTHGSALPFRFPRLRFPPPRAG